MPLILWLAAGLLSFAVTLPLILSLRRPAEGGEDRLAFDVALYRDQLDELERDRAAGTLSDADAASARIEIERRMLAADAHYKRQSGPRAVMTRGGAASLVVAVAVPGVALLLYLQVGHPGAPDQPLFARTEGLVTPDGSLDLAKAAEALRRKLAADPGSVEGWVLLARTEGARGRTAEAHEAFDRALASVPESDRALRGEVLGAYGELLTGEARGQVTPDAKRRFEEVVGIDSRDIRARYYLGLAMLQAGDRDGARAAWEALARDNPVDAPFQPRLREAIAAAANPQTADRQPPPAGSAPAGAAPPGAAQSGTTQSGTAQTGTAQTLAALPPEQQRQAIRGMVESLAARLESNPDDHDGWMRLGRSWAVLGERARAVEAYGKAASLTPEDAQTLQAYGDAIRGMDPADARLPDLDRRLAKLRGG